MKCGFAEQEIEKRGIVGLDDEEEDFFCRYSEESGANDGIGRVGPDSRVNEVGVPWSGRENSDLDSL